MTDPMANPLHACDVGDRVEQLTGIDNDVDLDAVGPSVEGRRHTRTPFAGTAPEPVDGDTDVDPETLLAYAVARVDSPLDVAEIAQRFGITPDHMFATVLDLLNSRRAVPIAPWVVDAIKDQARQHLWVHRC